MIYAYPILPVLLAAVLSMICGFVAMPLILRFCIKHKVYDEPNARKVHHNNIPRLGGVAFLPSMVLSCLITLTTFNSLCLDHTVSLNLWTCIFFLGLIIIYVTGLIDDVVGLRASVKFIIQLLVVSCLPFCYLYFNDLYGFLGFHQLPFWLGALVTVFFLVYTINALNLIDGIDGLCSSLSLIALGGFCILFYRVHFYTYTTIIAGMMGVLVPYTYYNLFGNEKENKKIFMGDAGSTTLGFLLGVLVVKYSMVTPLFPIDVANHLIVALSMIAVPLLDVARVILVRIHHHEGIFNPDKNHIHHKLLRAGLTQHQALLVILAAALTIIGGNLLMQNWIGTTWIAAINILFYLSFNIVINHFIKRRGNKIYVL